VKAQSSQAGTSSPQVVECLVQEAERVGASDIHLQMTGKSAEIRFRLDGLMTAPRSLPEDLA